MNLPKLAIDRSGVMDSTAPIMDGPLYSVFEYEKKGKKLYGFYVSDSFLRIPTDWKFGYKRRRDAHDDCLKMVSKKTPSVQERVLRDLQRVGHWVDIAWFTKKYCVSRHSVLVAAKSLRNKGLVEKEIRTKDGKKTHHVRAL